MLETITKNERETKRVAAILAKEILTSPLRSKAWIIGLSGELGSGKTTFIQGFAKGLEIKEKILSPTFVILKCFKIPQKVAHHPSLITHHLYHIDCYRLSKPKELLDLGFKEIIGASKNIVIIEWAEKVRKILPKDTIWIKFEVIGKKERKINII